MFKKSKFKLFSKKPHKEVEILNLIRQDNANCKNTLKIISDGLLVIDLKGFVISVNDAFYHLTGFTKKEIIGKHFTKLPTLGKKEMPSFIKILASFRNSESVGPGEFIWMDKDKRKRFGQFTSCKIYKNKKLYGFLIILRDLSKEKKQLMQLNEKNKQLEQRNKELEKIHSYSVDREHKMLELKKRIKELEDQLYG